MPLTRGIKPTVVGRKPVLAGRNERASSVRHEVGGSMLGAAAGSYLLPLRGFHAITR
jgi:hypothetical protein